jgi:hypothetical protein
MSDSENPALESGWLPTTPVGDTYLRRFLFNWAGMCASTARSLGGTSQEMPAVLMADCGRPAAFFNCATVIQPFSAATTSATLEQVAAFFAFDDSSRRGDVLLVSVWPTGDLRSSGWSLMGHPPVFLLPVGATPRPAPAELNIEEVHTLEALHAWERVAVEGYPLDSLAASPPGSLATESWLKEPRSRFWVGWVGDRPVCVSSSWTEHGINDVTLVATVGDARGRGFGEALTWCAALADPSLPAMLLSSDVARPIYERMGFLPLQRITLWYRNRPD